jgi:hypothetical protein
MAACYAILVEDGKDRVQVEQKSRPGGLEMERPIGPGLNWSEFSSARFSVEFYFRADSWSIPLNPAGKSEWINGNRGLHQEINGKSKK